MKKTLFYALLILAAALPILPCRAEKPRIAVISMERVFDKHHETQAANAQMKARIDEMEKDRQKMLDEMKKLKTEMETLGMEAADSSLSEAEQNKRKEKAKEKYAAYTNTEDRLIRFDRLSKSEFGSQMRDTQEKIVEDIRRTVKLYIKEKNIELVLDNSGKTMNGVEPVIYFDSTLDITDDIIALLNKATPSPAK